MAELVARLEPYDTRLGQALLTCLNPGTSHIKTIVNFARLYCMSGTGFHVLKRHVPSEFNDENVPSCYSTV